MSDLVARPEEATPGPASEVERVRWLIGRPGGWMRILSSVPLGKWMTVQHDRDREAGRTTSVWIVRGSDQSKLGEVAWYGAWRQYVFFPWPQTVLNKGCLRDLAAFCEEQMGERLADARKGVSETRGA